MFEALVSAGLFVRGGFHPGPDDSVPPLPDGRAAQTVLLIGNAGPAMWQALRAAVPDITGRQPLDRWLKPQIAAAAHAAGAHALFPNDGPPFIPIQRWALRADSVHASPIRLLIHPEFGLWHVYRAALLFAERIEVPPRADSASPCDTCAKKPCLRACPVDAFADLPARSRSGFASAEAGGFDVAGCVAHVESEAGGNCKQRGCMARRACPVGRANAYPVDAQAFHTAAFLRSAKRMLG